MTIAVVWSKTKEYACGYLRTNVPLSIVPLTITSRNHSKVEGLVWFGNAYVVRVIVIKSMDVAQRLLKVNGS